MNRRLAGSLALAIAVPGAALSIGDFRAGRSRLWASGGIIPLTAGRVESPAFFWAYTALNALFVTALIVAGALMVALP